MKKTIVIKGMTCNHCKVRVTQALVNVKGVATADVDVAKKNAVVELYAEVPDEVLKQAVSDAGYAAGAITNG